MGRNVTLPAVSGIEEVVSITEYPGRLVRFTVAVVNSDGVIVDTNRAEHYELAGGDFVELLSYNPVWAPGKPAGTYRNEDLWVFVDRKRGVSNA